MGVTAAEVNKLRKATGAGMMDCKKALQESNGDFDSAIDYLRKKGQKVSAKRAEREASEGVVIAKVQDDQKKGVVLALNCETDFVAKNEDFTKFAAQLTDLALDNSPENVDALKQLEMGGKTVADTLDEQVGKIGEKIEVSSYSKLEGEQVIAYNHLGNKIGVLVELSKGGDSKMVEAGRDVAMQIAAMNPLGIDKDDVDDATINREMEVAKEQIRAEGKPEDLVEKIATGKLNRFYKDNTLLNQEFVKDSKKTVGKFLKDIDPDLTVKAFKRISIGDA